MDNVSATSPIQIVHLDAFRELVQMLNVLKADVDLLAKRKKNDQFNRRMYVRSVFALIEGMVYRMKQICLSEPAERHYDFSAAEIALLREEAYELEDKGRVKIRPSKIRTPANVRFAFEAFSKYHGSDFTLEDRIGWQFFLQALKLRDRLMHPKFTGDLDVSDQEFEVTKAANTWFQKSVSLALSSATIALRKEIEESKERTRIFKEVIKDIETKYAGRMMEYDFTIELTYERHRRWLASIEAIGVEATASTRERAISKVQSLVFRSLAGQMTSGKRKSLLGPSSISFSISEKSLTPMT